MGLIPLAGNNTFPIMEEILQRIINKESKHIDEALAYFEFMARKENVRVFIRFFRFSNCAFADVELRENILWDSLMEAKQYMLLGRISRINSLL